MSCKLAKECNYSKNAENNQPEACFCLSLLRTSVASNPALSQSCLGITCRQIYLNSGIAYSRKLQYI
jgi:hypothetical protein